VFTKKDAEGLDHSLVRLELGRAQLMTVFGLAHAVLLESRHKTGNETMSNLSAGGNDVRFGSSEYIIDAYYRP